MSFHESNPKNSVSVSVKNTLTLTLIANPNFKALNRVSPEKPGMRAECGFITNEKGLP
jgi:hypothetical protein